jgi:hypothetical protein
MNRTEYTRPEIETSDVAISFRISSKKTHLLDQKRTLKNNARRARAGTRLTGRVSSGMPRGFP